MYINAAIRAETRIVSLIIILLNINYISINGV